MNITSTCDVINAAHQAQTTTLSHGMNSPRENFLRTPLAISNLPKKAMFYYKFRKKIRIDLLFV